MNIISQAMIEEYAQKCVEDMDIDVLMSEVKSSIVNRLEGETTDEVFEEIQNSAYSFLLLRDISVCSGTHRPQDLIPAFLEVLRYHDTEWYCAHIMRPFPMPPSYASEDEDDEWWDSDQCSNFLNGELFDRLNEIAPDGYYFGAHEGDGSDFGFWKDDEISSSLQ